MKGVIHVGTDGIPDKAPVDNSAESGGDDNLILYLGGGGALLLIVVLTLFFVLKGGDEDEMMQGDTGWAGGADAYGAVAQMDPMEQYVQQLIAQGYPEETARAYAQQYAAHFQGQQ